ncbi:hypothetical protein B0J15DRAFT_283260 [Fusarium solani]|uniref:Uncharacterized protein n=1 Tax=Fusarium solani TaxID=169388 RepID=A0A9P9HNL8_FUSSL|nr:uncharacterized protein B0J15DRAFT_283260 [Fusarium solani]KAH7260288.1 hypothetical protein B0J15DRAFT_283260 [Fusarium solani]
MGVNSLFGGGIRMLFKRAGSRLAPAVVMLCLLESVTRTKYTHTFIVVGRQSVNQSAGRRAALHICNTPFSLSFQAATFVDFFFYLPSFAGSLCVSFAIWSLFSLETLSRDGATTTLLLLTTRCLGKIQRSSKRLTTTRSTSDNKRLGLRTSVRPLERLTSKQRLALKTGTSVITSRI